MTPEDIRRRTQAVWDHFYALPRIWRRSRVARSWKGRLAFMLSSKLYRQMYANTGIATDSARHARSARIARWMAAPCRLLFAAAPMPHLEVPRVERRSTGDEPRATSGEPRSDPPKRWLVREIPAGDPT
jgi:hypothetical protein